MKKEIQIKHFFTFCIIIMTETTQEVCAALCSLPAVDYPYIDYISYNNRDYHCSTHSAAQL